MWNDLWINPNAWLRRHPTSIIGVQRGTEYQNAANQERSACGTYALHALGTECSFKISTLFQLSTFCCIADQLSCRDCSTNPRATSTNRGPLSCTAYNKIRLHSMVHRKYALLVRDVRFFWYRWDRISERKLALLSQKKYWTIHGSNLTLTFGLVERSSHSCPACQGLL